MRSPPTGPTNGRVTAAPCIVRRLNRLAEITEQRALNRRVEPIHFAGLHIGELIIDNAWQAERAEQTLTHFPRSELDRLSQFYAQQEDIRLWVEKEEEEAWAALRMLEGRSQPTGPGGHLGAAQRPTIGAQSQFPVGAELAKSSWIRRGADEARGERRSS